tara:strand:+ start:1851 stop:2036 length:186 start_codon:yes stop_codon:yes gene_type:complete
MKIYCVFMGDKYYPTGPGDIQKVFSTREAADAYEALLRSTPEFIKRRSYIWIEVSEHEVEN